VAEPLTPLYRITKSNISHLHRQHRPTPGREHPATRAPSIRIHLHRRERSLQLCSRARSAWWEAYNLRLHKYRLRHQQLPRSWSARCVYHPDSLLISGFDDPSLSNPRNWSEDLVITSRDYYDRVPPSRKTNLTIMHRRSVISTRLSKSPLVPRNDSTRPA
jgi:hypothetical protein